ncbi:MAG: hypothetical protein RIR51_409 [Bacteroidota bacterium]
MLKFLGILFLFIYIIRPLIKLLFKGYMFNQFQKFERTKMRTEKKQKKPECSINVDFVPKDSQKSNKKSSDHDDYVPFEEV